MPNSQRLLLSTWRNLTQNLGSTAAPRYIPVTPICNRPAPPRSFFSTFSISRVQNRSTTKRLPLFNTKRHIFSTAKWKSNLQGVQSEPQTLSSRLRKLSREYGWSAVGIYMALSALDFPFCFLAVRWLGTERVGAWEHAIVDWVKRAVPIEWPGKKQHQSLPEGDVEAVGMAPAGYDHGVAQAEKDNLGENASIWTQLALAYAIHKSFIFLRVPATVAVTPKVVKILRSWGWNIGKRTPKAEREARKAQYAAEQALKRKQS